MLNTCIMAGQVWREESTTIPPTSLSRPQEDTVVHSSWGTMEAWDRSLSAQTKAVLVPCFMKGIYSKVGFLTGTDWQCMPAERREASVLCVRASSFCIIGTSRAGLSVERLSLLSLS